MFCGVVVFFNVFFLFYEMEILAFPVETKSLELRRGLTCIIPLFYRVSGLLIAVPVDFIFLRRGEKVLLSVAGCFK